MRDVNRIYPFCEKLAYYWKTYYSELRFGQFMMCLFSWIEKEYKVTDVFFIEEDKMLEYLKAFCERGDK